MMAQSRDSKGITRYIAWIYSRVDTVFENPGKVCCWSSIKSQSRFHTPSDNTTIVFVRSKVCCLSGAPCSIPAAAECPGLITSPRPLHDPGRAEDTITSGPEPSSGRSVRRPAFHYFYSADLSSPGPDLLRSPLFTLVGVIKLNNANMPSAAVAID